MWGWPDVESHWTWPGQEGKHAEGRGLLLVRAGRALARTAQPLGEKSTSSADRRAFDVHVPRRAGSRPPAPERSDPATRATLVTRRRARGAACDRRPGADARRSQRPRVRADRGRGRGGYLVPARGRRSGDGRTVPASWPRSRAPTPRPRRVSRGPSRQPYRGVAQAIVRPTAVGASTSRSRPKASSRPGSRSSRAEPSLRATGAPQTGRQVTSWTWSTTARTVSTGVPGRTPWPRLKT